MKPPTPEQIDKTLKKILQYYRPLIVRGFSGTVLTRFDQGLLQRDISRHETDKLEEAS